MNKAPPLVRAESKVYFVALGKRICALRKARGMTQVELARAIGVSQQAVWSYELGRRVSVLILVKLAAVFGVSMEELAAISRPTCLSKGRISPRAVRHAERLQSLRKTQQRFVVRIIDVLKESNAR